MWRQYVRQNSPTGKSAKTCPAPCEKIFLSPRRANHFYNSVRLVPARGALAIVTKRGAGCGGRGGAFDERHRRGRRSRVVLTPRCRRQVGGKYSADDGDKKARSPGRARISRKPLRRGCRIASASPVCSCAQFFAQW